MAFRLSTSMLIVGIIAALMTTGARAGSLAPAKASRVTSVKVALPEAPISLDPQGTNSAQDSTIEIAKQIFDTLVVRTPKGKYAPDLATHWSNPNRNTWVFHLRSNAKFTNGQRVTAHDVVASLQRVVAQKGPISGLWAALKSVKAKGKNIVQIKTMHPLGTVLADLTFVFVAPASMINQASFWSKPIGSGPFKVASFIPDQSATLVANTHYWGGAPRLKKLNFVYIPDPSDLTSALRTGQIAVALAVDPTQVSSIQGTHGLTVKALPSYEYYFNWFNESRKPFTDKRVRQAMLYALPMKAIVQHVYGKYATVAQSPIPSTVFGYHKERVYPYNPSKARKLLKAAGYPNGFSTTLMWQANQAPLLKELATAFASYWSQVGINVQLTELDPATWLQRLLSLNWDMDFQKNSVLTGDADFALGRLYLSTAHRMGYSNPRLDRALIGGQESLKPAVRKKYYAQAINIIWHQAIGMYPLQVKLITAWRSNLTGFQPVSSGLPSFQRVG